MLHSLCGRWGTFSSAAAACEGVRKANAPFDHGSARCVLAKWFGGSQNRPVAALTAGHARATITHICVLDKAGL
jgi:hypothetical protein